MDILGQKVDIFGRKWIFQVKMDVWLLFLIKIEFLAENHKYFRKLIDSEEAGTHSQILEFQS